MLKVRGVVHDISSMYMWFMEEGVGSREMGTDRSKEIWSIKVSLLHNASFTRFIKV